jgi:hypothetical protein
MNLRIDITNLQSPALAPFGFVQGFIEVGEQQHFERLESNWKLIELGGPQHFEHVKSSRMSGLTASKLLVD